MKITSVPVTGAVQHYNEVKHKNSITLSPCMGRDQVEFSSNAKILSVALRAVKEAPDVRETRIAEIREKIANGTYGVASRQIAEKMMQSVAPDVVSK